MPGQPVVQPTEYQQLVQRLAELEAEVDTLKTPVDPSCNAAQPINEESLIPPAPAAELGSLTYGYAQATAPAPAKRLSAKQKAAIRASLKKQVKHNPKVVLTRKFLKKADLVDFSLPTVIRLNPSAPNGSAGARDGVDHATLDLGPSLGQRQVNLSGSVDAIINFRDAYEGGTPGEDDIW